MNFPKGQRAIAFDRATAFPLDANAYFESLVDAKAAVKTAEEVGSKLSAYYFGQQIAVVENDKATLYIIEKATVGEDIDARGYEGQLKEVGSKTLGDESSIVLDAEGVLSIYGFADAKDKCVPYKDIKTGKLIWGTVEGLIPDAVVPVGDGETIIVSADPNDNTKRVVSLLGKDGAADKAVLRKHISEEGTATYTWDVIYNKSEIDSIVSGLNTAIDAKAATTTVEAIEGRVSTAEGKISTLEGQITGLTGAMHFKGVIEGEALPSDFSDYAAGDVVLFGTKEYVCVEVEDGKAWRELGDEGSHLTKTEAEATYLKKADAETTYAKSADVNAELAQKVTAVEGKGLSTNDYDADAVAEVAKVKDKLDTSAFNTAKSEIDTAIADKQDKSDNLTGIAGMEAEGTGLIKKTADGYVYDANEYITDAALADYAKSADVTTEIAAAVADKQTATQVSTLIAEATINASKVDGKVDAAEVADKVVNKLKIGTKEFDGSEAVEIVAADLGALTSIPAATTTSLGGIKTGYESTATQRAVEISEDGKAFVTIPAATVYSAKADGGLEVVDNAFGIKALGVTNEMINSVSTDKLTQGTEELILNGGSATGSSK